MIRRVRSLPILLSVTIGVVCSPLNVFAADPFYWSNTENRPPLPAPVNPPPPSVNPTPTPLPNNNSQVQACNYYQVSASFVHEDDDYPQDSPMFKALSTAPVENLYNLACMREIFNSCSIPQNSVPLTQGFERLRDDCIFLRLAKIAGRNDCGQISAVAQECIESGAECPEAGLVVMPNCWDQPITVLFNPSCQNVSAIGTGCGAYAALALHTPISLFWETEKQITDFYSIVHFSMNPHRAAEWHTWRASAETPLIVYDPKHTGEISSGAQLFGEWSWGGKKYASLNGMLGGDRPAWKHGYEALAQLDSNNDGAIDGKELEPVALWFDRNQDAVSQPGEVVSAKDAKLTRLFFEHGPFDPATQSIPAKLGFEREIDGRIVSGGSVDWFSQAGASKSEIVIREQSRLALDVLPKIEPRESAFAAANVDERFNGMWSWQLVGEKTVDDKITTGGMLHLSYDPKTGALSGSSYVQAAMRDRSGNPLVKLTRLPVEGTVIGNPSERRIRIRAYDRNRQVSESIVTLSADGKELSGEATSSVAKGPGVQGVNQLSYRWTAKRY